MFVRFSMVHKVIQLEPSQRNCPLIMSHVLLSHSPHLSLPHSPSLSAPLCASQELFYLFIYFMPVPRFASLCTAFSKSAKLILILIEINEVIFFWRLLLPRFTLPPATMPRPLANILIRGWQMDFNFVPPAK